MGRSGKVCSAYYFDIVFGTAFYSVVCYILIFFRSVWQIMPVKSLDYSCHLIIKAAPPPILQTPAGYTPTHQGCTLPVSFSVFNNMQKRRPSYRRCPEADKRYLSPACGGREIHFRLISVLCKSLFTAYWVLFFFFLVTATAAAAIAAAPIPIANAPVFGLVSVLLSDLDSGALDSSWDSGASDSS